MNKKILSVLAAVLVLTCNAGAMEKRKMFSVHCVPIGERDVGIKATAYFSWPLLSPKIMSTEELNEIIEKQDNIISLDLTNYQKDFLPIDTTLWKSDKWKCLTKLTTINLNYSSAPKGVINTLFSNNPNLTEAYLCVKQVPLKEIKFENIKKLEILEIRPDDNLSDQIKALNTIIKTNPNLKKLMMPYFKEDTPWGKIDWKAAETLEQLWVLIGNMKKADLMTILEHKPKLSLNFIFYGLHGPSKELVLAVQEAQEQGYSNCKILYDNKEIDYDKWKES